MESELSLEVPSRGHSNDAHADEPVRESAFYSTDALLGSLMLLLGLSLGLAIALLWRRRSTPSQLLPSQIAAMLTHDMRAPLKGILGYIALLRERHEVRSEDLDGLEQSAHDLDLMLEAVLEHARSEAADLPLRNAPFALEDAIDETVAGLRPALRRKGLDLTAVLDPELPGLLVGDAQRMKQLLANLLGNAVKYTSEGAITLTVAVVVRDGSKHTVDISVGDTGPGFAAAARQVLFHPFSATEHHPLGSSGLGLALVKRLVETMSGDIVVDEGRERGADVRVRLPLQAGESLPSANGLRGCRIALREPHLPTRLAVTRMLEEFGCRVAISDSAESSPDGDMFDAWIASSSAAQSLPDDARVLTIRRPCHASHRHIAPCIETPVLPAMLYRALMDIIDAPASSSEHAGRCLVVDDDPLSLEHTRSLLTQSGWRAWTAIDAGHALRILREQEIDTVFLDLHLPDLESVHVAREARMSGVRSVIALSAQPEAATQAVFDFAIAKPLRKTSLELALAEAGASESVSELRGLARVTFAADLRDLRLALQRSDDTRAHAICHRLEGALRTLNAHEATACVQALRTDLRGSEPWQGRFDALERAVAAYLNPRR